jgi:hypothetical protein
VDADDARDIHDRTGAAAQHLPGDGAAGVERPAQVRVDDLLPVLVAHPGDQRVPRDARVVDEDVEVAQIGLDLLDQRLRLGRVADVRADGDPADLGRDRVGGLLAGPVVDRDLRPAAGELARDGGADAARPTGDERDLSFE